MKKKLAQLTALANVGNNWSQITQTKPLVQGKDMPEFWCRVAADEVFIFFGHPMTGELKYPMRYGQAYCTKTVERTLKIDPGGRKIDLRLEFKPYQSLLVNITKKGRVRFEDIYFRPKAPERA